MNLKKISLAVITAAAVIAVCLFSIMPIFATDTDLRVGSTTKVSKANTAYVTLYRTVNFTTYNVAATSDTVQLINLPKGFLVQEVALYVDTATTPTTTIHVGDGDAKNNWLSAVSTATAGAQTSSFNNAQTNASGKCYTAAGVLKFTARGAMTGGKLTVAASGVQAFPK